MTSAFQLDAEDGAWILGSSACLRKHLLYIAASNSKSIHVESKKRSLGSLLSPDRRKPVSTGSAGSSNAPPDGVGLAGAGPRPSPAGTFRGSRASHEVLHLFQVSTSARSASIACGNVCGAIGMLVCPRTRSSLWTGRCTDRGTSTERRERHAALRAIQRPVTDPPRLDK